MSFHGPSDPPRVMSPSRKNSAAGTGIQIPFKHILRLSNTATFPVLRSKSLKDIDATTVHSTTSRRRLTECFDADDVVPKVPMRSQPDWTIEGQHGLIKHAMLNDKRRVLTVDTAGEVTLWDIMKCIPVHNYGKRPMNEVFEEINPLESVAPWCHVDTRTGCLTCVLEETNVFDAEMYADEIDIEEKIDFKEDQRSKLLQPDPMPLTLSVFTNYVL